MAETTLAGMGIDSEKLREKIEAQVNRQIDDTVKLTVQGYMSKELVETIKILTKGIVAERTASLRATVENYLNLNTDRLCEVAAKQMVEEALGEVKRRVLGR